MDHSVPTVLEVFDQRLPRTARRFAHVHAHHELQLVLDPGTTILQRGSPFAAASGTLCVHRPPEEHGFVSDGAPTRFLVIHYLPDPALDAELPALGPDAPRRWHLDGQHLATFLDLFARMQVEFDGRRPAYAQAASAWLRLLLIAVSRFDAPMADPALRDGSRPVEEDVLRLRRAIDLRRQGSVESPLNGMVDNYDSLRHRFRRTFGESPRHMLARLRIEKAQGLLAEGDLSMAEIAAEVGYARQHEFSRAFHRIVGCTPTAFRRQHGPAT